MLTNIHFKLWCHCTDICNWRKHYLDPPWLRHRSITMVAFKPIIIRNIFQMHHLENHEYFADRARIEGIFHQKAFLQFFHTKRIQEITLDSALKFCNYYRKYLPEIAGDWFQNPVVLSRILFEIHFTHFTDMKDAHRDCCRTSAKWREGKAQRQKATTLGRITNTALVVIQRRCATWAALASRVYNFPREWRQVSWRGSV